MIQSRRRFLGLSVLVAAGSITALMTAQSAKAWLLAPFRVLYHRLLSPTLEDAATGPLSARTLNALMVATRTLTGVSAQITHYEDFFRWRSENLRGYKTLYEQFAAAVDRRARRSVGCDFVDCSPSMQQKILENVSQVRNANTRWDKVRVSVLERDWVLFDRYIVRDILLLFSKTNAWTLLGYEAWPGTPRGLDRYTQAPSKASYVQSAR
jgi:hypothetical protein